MICHLFGSEDHYVITGSHDRNERPEDAPHRLRDWRHGYAKLYGPRSRFGAEWNVLKLRKPGFGVGTTFTRLGDEDGVKLSLYAGRLGSLWLGVRHPALRRFVQARRTDKRRYDGLVTGLRFFPCEGSYVDWQFENREHYWSSADPWWQRWSLSDWQVWGRIESEAIEGDPVHGYVTLPEGTYKVNLTERTVTRRPTRWPGTWRHRTTTEVSWMVDVPGGIPVWGKGENSWDCGMDGKFGICCFPTPQEACDGLTAAVLRDRKRYGGPSLPRPMTVAEAGDWAAGRARA